MLQSITHPLQNNTLHRRATSNPSHKLFDASCPYPQSTLDRNGLNGGPVLLSNSQAGTGRNFFQPRALHLAHLCTYTSEST